MGAIDDGTTYFDTAVSYSQNVFMQLTTAVQPCSPWLGIEQGMLLN